MKKWCFLFCLFCFVSMAGCKSQQPVMGRIETDSVSIKSRSSVDSVSTEKYRTIVIDHTTRDTVLQIDSVVNIIKMQSNDTIYIKESEKDETPVLVNQLTKLQEILISLGVMGVGIILGVIISLIIKKLFRIK